MMNKIKRCIRFFIKSIPIIALFCVLFTSPSDTVPYTNLLLSQEFQLEDTSKSEKNPIVTFYALGDWGTGNHHQKIVAETLYDDFLHARKTEYQPFVLGLGDNVYRDGLPPQPYKNDIVCSLLKERFGDIYQKINLVFHVVPGNHDYYQSDVANMWGGRIHEETSAEYIFSDLKKGPVFKSYPIHHDTIIDSNDAKEHEQLQGKSLWQVAKPQKIELPGLDNNVLIVALDTQIWLMLHQQEKTALAQEYKKFLIEILQKSSAKWKILYGHHPIVSNGVHGGFRSTREWSWSGTRDRIPEYLRFCTFLWGSSISVLGDKVIEAVVPYTQDLHHPSYQKYITDLKEVIDSSSVDLIISGHDHNLQFIQVTDKTYQIISGSAGKLNSVTHNKSTIFSHESPGFVKFDVYPEKMAISFISVELDTSHQVTTTLFSIKK